MRFPRKIAPYFGTDFRAKGLQWTRKNLVQILGKIGLTN